MDRIYDYVVVGAGISGELIGALLSSDNRSVALIDKNDIVGGYVHNLQKGVPYGAHHIGVPDMKILLDICNKLGIQMEEHLVNANEIITDLDGKKITLSLELDQQKEQLIKYFPIEKDNIEKFISYMSEFGRALYKEDTNIVKKYFMELVNIPFEKLLKKYFSDVDLIGLLTLLGPCYGGITKSDSAFTFASLIATYGKGAFYFDGQWLVEKLREYIISRKNAEVFKAHQVQSMRYNIQDGSYSVYDDTKNEIKGRNIIFANYFVDILKDYCNCAEINDKKLCKIFNMEVGPSAYRIYCKINKELKRSEYVHIGKQKSHHLKEYSYILSTLDNDFCNIMLTIVTDEQILGGNEEYIIKESKAIIAEYFHSFLKEIDIVTICTPEDREKTTLNKYGSVFGWKRNNQNNMTANLIYEIDKSIKNVYVVGNWSATFGIFGAFYTVNKLYCKLRRI